jgi:hypothetical protein
VPRQSAAASSFAANGSTRELWIRPWIEVATFAAFCAQSRALHLPPWQPPPCNIGNIEGALNNTWDEPRSGYRAAALLRQRMERNNISRWHPDPARECERVEAERAKNQPVTRPGIT